MQKPPGKREALVYNTAAFICYKVGLLANTTLRSCWTHTYIYDPACLHLIKQRMYQPITSKENSKSVMITSN